VSAGPSWYDVLGVDPTADTDEIRAAWRAGIADLDPSDRRFRSLNQAAEVLLDPASRATYDASLVEPESDAVPASIAATPAAPPTHETGRTREPRATKAPQLP
jgi:Mce-associated membrane protein